MTVLVRGLRDIPRQRRKIPDIVGLLLLEPEAESIAPTGSIT
jgi:hypothetical protein